jgi:hypothetical protein
MIRLTFRYRRVGADAADLIYQLPSPAAVVGLCQLSTQFAQFALPALLALDFLPFVVGQLVYSLTSARPEGQRPVIS